ncbi:fimbrial protein [Rahnella rivi]|uniref:fimbrial protein n=1 Tax=Rahnella rivi TaxID=2816249 RepID=UPI0039BE66C0
MNNKSHFKTHILAVLGFTLSWIYPAHVFAGDAVICEPLNGGANSYENNLLHDLKSVENKKTFTFEETLNGGQQSYQIACNCTDSDAASSSGVQIIYSLRTSLPAGHAINYYKINDHVDLMTQISIPNNNYITVPTTNAVIDKTLHRDKTNTGVCRQHNTHDTFTTGSQGKLNFYITMPFVGEINIPHTEIARVYASAATSANPNPILGTPVAILYLSGTLTVPQSCEINEGEIISVNFGAIQASKFVTKNGRPDNYRPVNFDIRYNCTKNGLPVIPVGNKLTMILEGQDVQDQYYLVARRRPSDNKADIGIMIENTGTYIPFTMGVLAINQTGQGKLSLEAIPINLVGGELDTGPFQATATLKIDIR